MRMRKPDPRHVRAIVEVTLMELERNPACDIRETIELAAYRLLRLDPQDPAAVDVWVALVLTASYGIGSYACRYTFNEYSASLFLDFLGLGRPPQSLRKASREIAKDYDHGFTPESALRDAAFLVLRGSDATVPHDPIAAWEREPAPEKLDAYLRASVLRSARNALRDRQQGDDMWRNFKAAFREEVGVEDAVVGLADETELPAPEAPEWLEEGLRSLPARTQQVARLYLDGLTQTEIAQHLGISQPAVSKHLANARQTLHQHLLSA